MDPIKHFPHVSYDVQLYRSVKGAYLCWALALALFAAAWIWNLVPQDEMVQG